MPDTGKIDLEKTASKAGFSLSELKRFFWILYKKKAVKNSEFVRETGLPKSLMRKVLENLRPLLNEPSQFVVLNEKGRAFVEETILEPLIGTRPLSFKNENLTENQHYQRIRSYQRQRPCSNRNLDQFPVTTDTLIKRVMTIQKENDLTGKSILFLGDYDLTSLMLALAGKAQRILVVDVDRRLLDFIKRISRKENLKIECLRYDVREALPVTLKNTFDFVFSDPPYTPGGLQVFLSRAIEAVKKREGILYFCYGYSQRALERGWEAQRIFTQSGLLIESKYANFNVYEGAGSIGSQSSLYILKTTPKTQVIIKEHFKGPIYTGRKTRI